MSTFSKAGTSEFVAIVSSSLDIVEVESSSFHKIKTRIFLFDILLFRTIVSEIGSLNVENVIFSPSSTEYPVATKSVTELFFEADTFISYLNETSIFVKSKFKSK